MKTLTIFLVEDDPFFGEMMKYHLSLNPDYDIHLFSNAKECLANLYLNPDVISLDYGLPDMQGDVLFKRLKELHPNLPLIVLSGQEDVRIAVEFLKSGAHDYIVKGEHTKELLWNSLLKLREKISLKNEVNELKDALEVKYAFQNTIVGQSEALKSVFNKLSKAIQTNINISITGETGTGKEVIAKAIHFNSDRKKKPFVAVNMAAIPKELMESEFFGYEKGAFTGAVSRTIGKFEQANKGTLFLDEIAELDLSLQSKLLRALQEREITRIGGTEKVKFNARIIIATHKNLAEEVRQGNFREDLYYRIIGLPIYLPPLRERGQDVLLLAKHFLDLFAKENNLKPKILSEGAKKKLLKYNFPGNVRELKSIMDLASVMADEAKIQTEDLQFNELSVREKNFLKNQKTLKQHTNEIILYYLKKNDNDVLKTAKILDIGKSTIYNLLQQTKEKHSYESR